ncbi:MAG: histidine phosphatase family protein [Alphaproteobacteria bacterium]|jgi:alpha-ribazole phosphatase|nr:histidine phosphatase family protein [Alphaproteobacteria bacterium]
MPETETAPVTRWWWVRHAPVINPGDRLYGQMDLAADTGDGTAFATVAARLPPAADWLVTPLGRTGATADAILAADPHGRLAPRGREAVPDLMEQHFGDWQGLTQQEIFVRFPGVAGRFWEDPAETRPPGGESFADLMARTAAAIDRLSAAHPGRDIVAVAHGGTIRAALALALTLEPAAALRVVVDTLSLTRLDRVEMGKGPPAWRVDCVNIRPHS